MNAEEAKRLAAGQLGDQMAKFPARFCKAIMFGKHPSRELPAIVNNGTATLLAKGNKKFAVTCSHVVEEYRRQIAADPATFFAIGNEHFDPLPRIVMEDRATDVAVIELESRQAARIAKGDTPIGVDFFHVDVSPSGAHVNDYVAFAGFPGDLREQVTIAEMSFGCYCSGACRVTDAHADYITCQFEREFWVTNFKEREPAHLGGMSGGPIFVIRHSEAGIMSHEFAGIIFRMHDETQSLYARVARAISLP